MGAWIQVEYIILTFSFINHVMKRGKIAKKVWVLAPTTLKSMGAEAPTAPVPSGALYIEFEDILIN